MQVDENQLKESAIDEPIGELTIEVAYALPDRQIIIAVQAQPGITAREAIVASGILDAFPEIGLDTSKIGIFGKHVHQHARLENHDRVEIYRPLMADPKELRRQRAAAAASIKKGSD